MIRGIKRKNGGVTLIALIITIIVLLILAGVSISMVAGDNGILTQAVNAADSNNLAEVKSDLSLALATCQTNYYGDRYGDVGTDIQIADYFTTSKIKTEMGDDYSSVTGTITIGSASTLTITKTNGEVYTAVVTISDIGGVTISSIVESETSSGGGATSGISASDISENASTYYGSVVTNYTVADEDLQTALTTEGIEWKIFYADSSNVYLIASDYVPVENAPANSSGSTPVYSSDYPYGLYLYNVYSVYSGASNITNSELIKWNSLYYGSYSTSTNTNMKCVAYLMDTSLWSDYANTNYATYAIGGTTLEMWVASWNEKGYTTLYYDNINSYGYYVGTSSTPTTTYQYVTSSYVDNSGYGDTLYFPHQNNTDRTNCSGYWLASTSGAEYMGQVYLMNVRCTGGLMYSLYNVSNIGFRPLVCLTSDVQLQGNSDGTYSIIE